MGKNGMSLLSSRSSMHVRPDSTRFGGIPNANNNMRPSLLNLNQPSNTIPEGGRPSLLGGVGLNTSTNAQQRSSSAGSSTGLDDIVQLQDVNHPAHLLHLIEKAITSSSS